MIKNLKKAFTIIELVIVIAVIAILAAVMIPTYSSLAKKANVSKDTQLVRNLNTALATNPDGHKTMSEALASAEANGYDVSKINASATDNEILWDSVNDVFCYLNGDEIKYIPNTKEKDVEDYQYWQICSEVPSIQTYSIYWNGTSGITSGNELTVGFDSGKTTGNNIKYTGINSVIIKTNSGDNLEVSNEQANVSHYGEANFVTLTAVATLSYHEYGEVIGIKLKKGRVVIEKEGKVNNIIVTSDDANEIQVESNGGQVGAIGATKSDVVSGLTSRVDGIDNDIISSEPVEEDSFASGLGTEKAPYIISSKEEWTALANKCKTEDDAKEATDGKYYSIITDLDFYGYQGLVSLEYFYGNLDFNNHKVLNVQLNNNQINNYKNGNNLHYYGALIYTAVGDVTIKNISEFNVYSPTVDSTLKLIARTYNKSGEKNTLKLENIKISGTANLTDNNTGVFLYTSGTANVVLKDCINYTNINNTNNYTGVFIGRNTAYDKESEYIQNVSFVNCYNYGKIITTSTNENSIGMLIANPNGSGSINIDVKNCINYGQMITAGGYTTKNVAAGNIQNIKITGEVTGNQIATVSFEKIELNDDKFIIKSVSGANRYEMVFSFSGAAYAGGVLSTTFELTEDDLNNVAAYNWKYNTANNSIENIKSENKYGTTVKTAIIDGITYYVADTANTTNTPVSVVVYAYDASNNIIGYSTYTYTK